MIIDSEMSEILSDLCHEDGHAADLKDMQAVRRTARLKRKGIIDNDNPLDEPKRRIGTGQGEKGGAEGWQRTR